MINRNSEGAPHASMELHRRSAEMSANQTDFALTDMVRPPLPAQAPGDGATPGEWLAYSDRIEAYNRPTFVALRLRSDAEAVAAQRDLATAQREAAEVQRLAVAAVNTAPGIDRRAELFAIVRKLIEKRVTATTLIGGTSKGSAAQLAADARLIQMAVEAALVPQPVPGVQA